MPESIADNPERRVIVPDNARKFIASSVDAKSITGEEVVSYRLVTDWLETNEDSEAKVVLKEFLTGEMQTLLITKMTKGSNRTADKKVISSTEYEELIASSIIRIEKIRHEFIIKQGERVFEVKYDQFTGSNLCVIEVDGETRDKFDPSSFMLGDLQEVSDDRGYEGFRIADKL